jgi:predicted aldo/keto reductase-like oxidoreductase
MQYKQIGNSDRNGSILGFGCMRLPLREDSTGKSGFERQQDIDEEKAIEMIEYAIEHGVNYFDSAYMYHGGKSEEFLGKAMKNRRDKFIITTKSPVNMMRTSDDLNRILDEQLKRLNMDYLDFYLLHGMDRKGWDKGKELGVLSFLDKILKDGRAKYAGFSFHDEYKTFKEIIDAYDWTVCQIQYNYFDENYQAGKKGLKYAASKGIGVIIMEPLRGGRLTNNIPEEVQKIWSSAKRQWSPAEWGLRWIWDQSEVSLLLSGMTTLDQVKENIRIAENASMNSVTTEDFVILKKVSDAYRSLIKVDCTECGYCSSCPNEIPIPMIFSLYNDYFMFKDLDRVRMMYNMWIPPEKQASNCVMCGECQDKCPQHLEIIEYLKEAHDLLHMDMPPMPPRENQEKK